MSKTLVLFSMKLRAKFRPHHSNLRVCGPLQHKSNHQDLHIKFTASH
jgi:hypothetical protein